MGDCCISANNQSKNKNAGNAQKMETLEQWEENNYQSDEIEM